MSLETSTKKLGSTSSATASDKTIITAVNTPKVAKIVLEVLDGNDAAQALYRRCGYAPYALDAAHGAARFWHKPLA